MSGLVVRPGFAIVWDELIYDQRLSHTAFRLYAVLWKHGSSQGTACPSVNRLSELMGVSRETVMRAKGDLVDLGYITVEKRHYRDTNGDGRRQTDLIRLFVPGGTDATPLGGKDATYPPGKDATYKTKTLKDNETLGGGGAGAPPPPASRSSAHHVQEWVPKKHEPIPEDERARIHAAVKARP